MLQQHGTLWRTRTTVVGGRVACHLVFLGWPDPIFCVSGRLASELADFAAVLLATSWTGRATLDPADCAASFLEDPFVRAVGEDQRRTSVEYRA